MTMLSARGVKIDLVEELIAAGLAVTSIERVGRRAMEIVRVKITEAGRRAPRTVTAHLSARAGALRVQMKSMAGAGHG